METELSSSAGAVCVESAYTLRHLQSSPALWRFLLTPSMGFLQYKVTLITHFLECILLVIELKLNSDLFYVHSTLQIVIANWVI